MLLLLLLLPRELKSQRVWQSRGDLPRSQRQAGEGALQVQGARAQGSGRGVRAHERREVWGVLRKVRIIFTRELASLVMWKALWGGLGGYMVVWRARRARGRSISVDVEKPRRSSKK